MEDSKEDMEKIQIIYVYISFLFFFYLGVCETPKAA